MISSLKITIILFSAALLSLSSIQPLYQGRLAQAKDRSLSTSSANDSWIEVEELHARLGRILEACGELCSIETLDDFNRRAQNIDGYPTFTAKIDCGKLMSSDDVDATDLSFPTEIPKEIVSLYTLNGLIPIKPFPRFYKDAYLGKEARSNVWTKEDVDAKVKDAKEGILKGTHNWAGLASEVKSKLGEMDLKGKSILVIGSEDPWVEVICLALGAAKVTTLEYEKISSLHPQIEAFTPDTFRERFMKKSLEYFDGVVSISSPVHSGFERYGDALNPWGDLIATGRAWCVTKSNGFLLLGLPGGNEDSIRYNANRMYGKYRWPLITTNWKVQNLDMNNNYLMEKNTPNTIHSFKKIDDQVNTADKFVEFFPQNYLRNV